MHTSGWPPSVPIDLLSPILCGLLNAVLLCTAPYRSTTHIFLDLPKLSPKLQAYITNTSQLGGWSSNCVQVGGHEMHSKGGAREAYAAQCLPNNPTSSHLPMHTPPPPPR